jgi:hypothetical protein
MKEKMTVRSRVVTEAAGSEACIAKIRHQASKGGTEPWANSLELQGKGSCNALLACSSARHTIVDAARSSTSQKEKKKIVHARRALAN